MERRLQPTRPVILVIEDDRATVDLLCDVLGEEGYAVEVATNGTAGLARLESGRIDVVLLDLKLPDMDGLELCQRVRTSGAYRDVPIIMLSAAADERHRLEGFAAGADDYVTKPFSLDEFVARVKAL